MMSGILNDAVLCVIEADPHVVLDKLLNKDPLVVLDKLLNEGRNSAPGRWEVMGLANWGWWLWSKAFKTETKLFSIELYTV